MGEKKDIAIIGMGCIFPESSNLKAYWHLLFNGVDAITQIPSDTHWPLDDYYHEDPRERDHTYCRRGGFLSPVRFDPLKYGIPPNNIDATDTSQLLGLEVACMALENAGYPINHTYLEEKKVNVILGVTGTQELVIPLGARLSYPVWERALTDTGISREKKEEIIDRIKSGYVEWQENSFPGLLGNVVAGRIANRLNLSGTNSVSDAACASSLSAIHTAVLELQTKKCDMSISGGVDALNDIFMHMCFSKTGVLSRQSDARPFSRDADGTVLGEGVGMLILKRLEDAKRDKDRIYAVIRGVGTSSDGRTSAIYAPESKGQLKALQQAYHEADIDPSTISLVEAHGTGTRVGDKVEFQALNTCFNQAGSMKNKTAVGSVKSQIGHTKAAAGAAGMIKAALSLYHKVIPPTLKAGEPDPELDINDSPFYLNSLSKPWVSDPAHPRRAGVSAFGFGGSNFHLVLEEYAERKETVSWNGRVQIIAFSSPTKEGILEQLAAFETAVSAPEDPETLAQTIAWTACKTRQQFSRDHQFRLVFVHTYPPNIKEKIKENIANAKAAVEDDKAHKNIFYSKGTQEGKLGFIFPGQGSQYIQMGKILFSTFPNALDALEKANQVFHSFYLETNDPKKVSDDHSHLSSYLFPPPEHLQPVSVSKAQLKKTDVAQPAIGAVSLAMVSILKQFGIVPDMTCGHSFGELTALYAAGWIREDDFLALAAARGKYMAAAGKEGSDPGSMLAVHAPLEKIGQMVSDNDLDLVLANQNSPVQGILSGATPEILRARDVFKKQKIRTVQLEVAAAFHTPFVAPAVEPFKNSIQNVHFSPTPVDVCANSTGKIYPEDPEDIKKLLASHLNHPVRFVDNIRMMERHNVSCMIEVGPGSVLTNLIRSIVDPEKVSLISTDSSSGRRDSGMEDLARVLAMVAAQGFCVDLNQWEPDVEQPEIKKMSVAVCGANPKPKQRPTQIGSRVKPEVTANQTTPDDNRSRTEDFEKTKIKRREIKRPKPKGLDMTQKDKPSNRQQVTTTSVESMRMIEKGFEAMQQLQTQTAQAHEKFLETQAQASKTLAAMMEHSRTFARGTGPSLSMPSPAVFGPDTSKAPLNNQSSWISQASPQGAQRENFPEIDIENSSTPTSGDKIMPETAAPHTELTAENKAAPVSESSSAMTQSANRVKTRQVLFDIVSRLTGFPADMLESDMDMESDLGIDSIKKVEIISELEKELPSCEGLTTENIGTVRTLEEVCIAIEENTVPAPEPNTPPVQQHHMGQDILNNETDSAPVDPEGRESGENDLSVEVSTVLKGVISELTGFPDDMLTPDMDLESDLGIDSIKRVEILSRLEQELDHIDTISPDNTADLRTIGEISQFLTPKKKTSNDPGQHQPHPITAPSGTVTSSKEDADDPAESSRNSLKPDPVSKANLLRQVVSLQSYPIHDVRFNNGAKIQIDPEKKVYITQDQSGIALALKAQFEQERIAAELIELDADNLPELPGAAGIVLVPDAFHADSQQAACDFIHASFLLIQKNAAHLVGAGKSKAAFLTGISFLGGHFGFRDQPFHCDPAYGGMAGLIKTASLEFDHVLCRSLDLPDTIDACIGHAENAVSLMMTQGSVEMGLDKDACNIPVLKDEALTQHALDFSNHDRVVITGGAKGVTAACAIALSKEYTPELILIGRSSEPFQLPEWAEGITDAAALKKAIIAHEFNGRTPTPVDVQTSFNQLVSNREIVQNIEQMEAHGSKVTYFSADITDKSQIDQIIQQVTADGRPVSAVIHGAGVLEDKLIVDKRSDQFCRVMDTKVRGMNSLLSAVNHSYLKYLVFFSSVAARTGNRGQCDYAAANEILNKTARKFASQHPDIKVLSVNWGPWEGGMVDASLKKAFQSKGIALIPLAAGAGQLVKEMGNAGQKEIEVVIGADLLGREKKKPQRFFTALSMEVGIESAPVLNSHKIGGDPVFPFALLMDLHAHAAEKSNPGLVVAGMDDMQLFKGVIPENAAAHLDVNVSRLTLKKNRYHLSSKILSTNDQGKTFLHSGCTVILKDRLPEPPVLSQAVLKDLTPYPLSVDQVYEDLLFHGKKMQCIQSIDGYSKKGITITTQLSPDPKQWLTSPYGKKWAIEPLMLDAAFQAAVLWSYQKTGQVCLPNAIANFRLYRSFETIKEPVKVLFTVNEVTKMKIKGYFTFQDANGQVVAGITGFEAVTDPLLTRKFKEKPMFSIKSLLAFAQGKPSAAFGKKYEIFDEQRQVARLPRPPYLLMDRVIKSDHPQWEMAPGGWIEAQYDIPEDAWYFNANRSDTIPFAILLEIALQPCGWLAAYAGSSLQSDERLYFRNLGGVGTWIKPLSKYDDTVTIKTRMTNVSKAGSTIIQHFDVSLFNKDTKVYEGQTHFGFFTQKALANQSGIGQSSLNEYLLPEEKNNAFQPLEFKQTAPLTPDDQNQDKNDGMPSSALRMIDSIDVLSLKGGIYENGYVKATKKVDPDEWFFQAHFYQDPVCPGSLGIESFLQMVRFFLIQKFAVNAFVSQGNGDLPEGRDLYDIQISPTDSHEWIYRGQIIPENKDITIHAHIKKAVKKGNDFSVIADGALCVDGLCIYEMKNFGMVLKRITRKHTIRQGSQTSM